MAQMTGAERQAASKARKEEAFTAMAQAVVALREENAALHAQLAEMIERVNAQLAEMVERVHAAEMKALAAELKLAKAAKK
jgi:hypothetical protein